MKTYMFHSAEKRNNETKMVLSTTIGVEQVGKSQGLD